MTFSAFQSSIICQQNEKGVKGHFCKFTGFGIATCQHVKRLYKLLSYVIQIYLLYVIFILENKKKNQILQSVYVKDPSKTTAENKN